MGADTIVAYDLTAAREIALGIEMLVEEHEQLGDQSSFCQRLAEQHKWSRRAPGRRAQGPGSA
jgi:hypothetical protein